MNLFKRIDNAVTDFFAAVLEDPSVNIALVLLTLAVYAAIFYCLYRWPFQVLGLTLIYVLDKRWAK